MEKQNYTLTRLNDQYVQRFGIHTSAWQLHVQHTDSDDLEAYVEGVLQEVIDLTLQDANDEDMIGLEFVNEDLPDGPILIGFSGRSQLNAKLVIDRVNAVLNSNQSINIMDVASYVNVVRVRQPSGSGRALRCLTRIERKRQCRHTINIEGAYMCMARSIVVARARCHRHDDRAAMDLYQNIRRYKNVQMRYARQLLLEADLPVDRALNITRDIEAMRATLGVQYEIRVWTDDHRMKPCTPSTPRTNPMPQHYIDLYLADDHYEPVTTVTGFLGRNSFCNTCNSSWVRNGSTTLHECKNACAACRSPGIPCIDAGAPIHCTKCNRTMKSVDCFAR